MKLIGILFLLVINPFEILCQCDSRYYLQSNYGYKYYNEGEYDKSIQAYSLINDSLLRYKDYLVLLNVYGNRNDTINLKKIIAKYSYYNNYCEKIFNIKNLSKYQDLIKNICQNKFDSVYNTKYTSVKHIVSYLDTSIKYSNIYRLKETFDSDKLLAVDKDAYSFFLKCDTKEIAQAFNYITQKEHKFYRNLHTTLIHMNYYDSESSKNVEKWAKELMFYGLLEPKDYAYIIDRRIEEIEKGKQKYGEHQWKYNPLEINQINKNRAEIGLVPLN